jgi:hypothetical protein
MRMERKLTAILCADVRSYSRTFPLCVEAENADLAAARRMQFRIGINLGDIIVDDQIYGDGVSVAARLESLAEPGGICNFGQGAGGG